jgi:hypothetical protein
VEQPTEIPAWLRPNVGNGGGQIAPVVLQKARALYFQKVRAGAVRNSCYLTMDATRPHDLGDGKVAARFYVTCEPARSFLAISAGFVWLQRYQEANKQDGRRRPKYWGVFAASMTDESLRRSHCGA